jgi:hypothetical protein
MRRTTFLSPSQGITAQVVQVLSEQGAQPMLLPSHVTWQDSAWREGCPLSNLHRGLPAKLFLQKG